MSSESARTDPEAAAITRAGALPQRLIESVETITTAEAATRLGLTEADIRTAREDGRLLAVDFSGQEHYPVFQFLANDVRPEMAHVLSALDDVPIASSRVRLAFLTAPGAAEEDDRSVVDLIRDGEITEALVAISRFGKLGA